jgi:hypothetical protein
MPNECEADNDGLVIKSFSLASIFDAFQMCVQCVYCGRLVERGEYLGNVRVVFIIGRVIYGLYIWGGGWGVKV